MLGSMRDTHAGGQPSGLVDIAHNSAILDPHRNGRLAEFMANTTSMKSYLREHCNDVVIDLTEFPWTSYWPDTFLYLPSGEGTEPERAHACVNVAIDRLPVEVFWCNQECSPPL